MDTAGFRGVWYSNQAQNDEYRFKYSGGLATYPQQITPVAVRAAEVGKTFFTVGGSNSRGEIENLVAWFDHRTGEVCQPRRLLTRMTSDAHYNATLAVDGSGYVHVFCNAHGVGGEQVPEDPTYGRAYVMRGRTPFSIDDLEVVIDENFSYSQVWPRSDGSLLWLHTRYVEDEGSAGPRRTLYWGTLRDGQQVGPHGELAAVASGSYQVSAAFGDTVWTAFDQHPRDGGLNARTNIYVARHDPETGWCDSRGDRLELPLTQVDNPALVRDYEHTGQLVYLKDIAFDATGEPYILYLLSTSPWSGPLQPERSWHVLYREHGEWVDRQIATSSHNYDHGFLRIDESGSWHLLAPLEPGPQPFGTGGQVVWRRSKDRGRTWETIRRYPVLDGRNQTYVRPVFGAANDFCAIWADGDAYERSESSVYVTNRNGDLFRLPRTFERETAQLEPVETRQQSRRHG